jgi:hypothetical protein
MVENGMGLGQRDVMPDLNGHEDDAHSSQRQPIVTHSSYSHSALLVGDSISQRSADEDFDMTE